VADRKAFLLRIDSDVLEGVQRWANDDLRSLNAQIEYLLRESLRRAGRATRSSAVPSASAEHEPASPAGDTPKASDPSTDS
jgi:hypothetical protein